MLIQKIKCVVLGDKSVGKSCFIETYSTGAFPANVPKTCQLYSELIKVDISHTINFLLWDSCGTYNPDEESYFSSESIMNRLMFRDVDVFLVCFAIDSRDSFLNCVVWTSLIKKHCPRIPYIIVGLKADLRGKIRIHDEAFGSIKAVPSKVGESQNLNGCIPSCMLFGRHRNRNNRRQNDVVLSEKKEISQETTKLDPLGPEDSNPDHTVAGSDSMLCRRKSRKISGAGLAGAVKPEITVTESVVKLEDNVSQHPHTDEDFWVSDSRNQVSTHLQKVQMEFQPDVNMGDGVKDLVEDHSPGAVHVEPRLVQNRKDSIESDRMNTTDAPDKVNGELIVEPEFAPDLEPVTAAPRRRRSSRRSSGGSNLIDPVEAIKGKDADSSQKCIPSSSSNKIKINSVESQSESITARKNSRRMSASSLKDRPVAPPLGSKTLIHVLSPANKIHNSDGIDGSQSTHADRRSSSRTRQFESGGHRLHSESREYASFQFQSGKQRQSMPGYKKSGLGSITRGISLLEGDVEVSEGVELSHNCGARGYVECSSLDKEGVGDIIVQAIRIALYFKNKRQSSCNVS